MIIIKGNFSSYDSCRFCVLCGEENPPSEVTLKGIKLRVCRTHALGAKEGRWTIESPKPSPRVSKRLQNALPLAIR